MCNGFIMVLSLLGGLIPLPQFKDPKPVLTSNIMPRATGAARRNWSGVRIAVSITTITLLAIQLACGGPTMNRVPEEATNPSRSQTQATLQDQVVAYGNVRELDSFKQVVPRDQIRPIYEPSFVKVSESSLSPEEMVIGVSIGDDARAYPIRYLRWREMVNDEVGGIPILVTW